MLRGMTIANLTVSIESIMQIPVGRLTKDPGNRGGTRVPFQNFKSAFALDFEVFMQIPLRHSHHIPTTFPDMDVELLYIAWLRCFLPFRAVWDGSVQACSSFAGYHQGAAATSTIATQS